MLLFDVFIMHRVLSSCVQSWRKFGTFRITPFTLHSIGLALLMTRWVVSLKVGDHTVLQLDYITSNHGKMGPLLVFSALEGYEHDRSFTFPAASDFQLQLHYRQEWRDNRWVRLT